MPNPSPGGNGTPRAASADLQASDDLRLLLTDPSRVARVPIHQLPVLLTQLASLQTRIAAVGSAVAARFVADRALQAEPDRLLTAAEAADRLGVTKDWLRRRSTLPFVVRLSEGVVRFSTAGIDDFLIAHRPKDA